MLGGMSAIACKNIKILYSFGTMKRSELILNAALVPVDFIMLLLAGALAYGVRTQILDELRPVQFAFRLPFERYILIVAVVACFFLIAYALSGLYRLRTTRRFLQEFSRIAIASSAGLMAVIIYIFLKAEIFDSRFLVLGAWALGIIMVSLGRFMMRRLQRLLALRYNLGVHRVLVIGDDELSQSLVAQMQSDPGAGYRVVKQLAHPELSEVRSAVGNPGVDEVILANPNYPAERVVELVEFCHEHHLAFRFVPNLYQTLTKNFSFDTYTGVPFVELRRTALDEWGRVFKRSMDITGAVVGLIVLSPLFAIIALAIKWTSAGPVLVRLARVSRGKHFALLKFRSMIRNAEELKVMLAPYNERKDSPLFKMKNDPRITRVGRFLRRYRLDEFPQLWNVLIGEISLVGPRPHEPAEIANYEKHHKRVLAIKAGVTGLAQVSGSSDLPFEKEVALDTLYIESWSLGQDIKIILMTLLKLVRDRSAV